MIRLFKKREVVEAKPYTEIRKPQPPPDLYNEVMKHQHEMRKQLYRELKLK
jgi:hypothetical protein